MSKVAYLLVTCCLEPLRAKTLHKVVNNMKEQMPELLPVIDVFDNASTEQGTIELLTSTFKNVYVADKNVGYWSAIWWWLEQLVHDPPDYTYIIESDMTHYDFHKFWNCVSFLNEHPFVGSVRLQKYSYIERSRYNKDVQHPNSYVNYLQSHTNHATGEPVVFFDKNIGGIMETTFLTKLPALNRYATMRRVFNKMLHMEKFSEHDFQKLYWEEYQRTGLLDGGIHHDDLAGYGIENITGSWTDEAVLRQLGYQPTRFASITSPHLYSVTQLS